jgi:hypothetical protein
VTDTSADAGSDISRQWIIAHILGGVAFNVVPTTIDPMIRWIGITAGNVGAIELLVLGIAYVAAYSLALILLGYLTGAVLRQKLLLFPLRAWLTLFGMFGVLIGLFMATTWFIEDNELDRTGFDDIAELVVVAGILGMLIGAIYGSSQVFVLRKVAGGLSRWVVYSTIAGLPIIVMALPVAIYEPLWGVNRETLEAGTGLFATVAGAFIMLPAVHQLRPR